MKEIYCFQCRRYKKAELFPSAEKNRAKCSSCISVAEKLSSRTEEEIKKDHDNNVKKGKYYKRNVSDKYLKLLDK